MADTPTLALAIAACGGLSMLILARALFDVLAQQDPDQAETDG